MKLTVHKYIMAPLSNQHLLLNRLMLNFMQLAQVDKQNGTLGFNNLQKVCNHFGQLTIFLVLEDHQMMCYWQ